MSDSNIVYVFSRDLMFSSRTSGSLNAAGMQSKSIGNVEQIEPGDSCIVILDLTNPGIDIAATVSQLRALEGTKVVAVGPHVQEGRLNAAREAGADLVITNGQASRELPELLGQLQD